MTRTSTRLPVAVGVDGLPGSAGALRYAITEARRRGVALRLVHVVPTYPYAGPPIPDDDLRRIGGALLEEQAEMARRLDPTLEVDTLLTRGDRPTGMVKAAVDAQLLVLGRQSRRGVDRFLTGTTTAAVAARASCDVVVVPSFWMEGDRRGRVVVGVKSHRNSRELLAEAFLEAAERGATLRVVTAWELADPYFDRIEVRTHEADWIANGTEVLEQVTAEWRTAHPDVPVEIGVVHGAAAKVLLHESIDSDLLVISRRRLALPPHGRLGGVGYSLLRLSDVPVHVVPYVADPVIDDELVLEEAGVLLK